MTAIKPSLESAVLMRKDPSLDSDDWPEFTLHDATVTASSTKNGSEIVSLLAASEHYPLVVTGRLESVSKDLAHLLILPSNKRAKHIELPDVRSFAYGEIDGGDIELWAAGQAGWYIIRPSKRYRRLYGQATDAVRTFFFITDTYRRLVKTRRKGKSASPEFGPRDLFEKYAREILSRPNDVEEAAERIYRHRDFLLSSMLTGKEGIDWAQNPLFEHLSSRFPDTVAEVKQRTLGVSPSMKLASLKDAASPHTSEHSAQRKREQGRSPRSKSTAVVRMSSSAVRSTRGVSQELPPTPASEVVQIEESASSPEASTTEEESTRPLNRSGLRPPATRPMKGPLRTSRSDKVPVDRGFSGDNQRPYSGKRKRGHTGDSRRSKQQTSTAEVDAGFDGPISPSVSAEDLCPTEVSHLPDPVQEDTWVCALDGCTHKVYAASTPDAQRLIREHYSLHAYDDDERVQLVKQLHAPSLPVAHLMEKVRIQAKMDGFPGSRVAGTRYPEPLRQKV